MKMAKRKRGEAPPGAPGEEPAGKLAKLRFRVSLEHEETLEIDAADEEDAWRRYQRLRGIVASDHTPHVERISR